MVPIRRSPQQLGIRQLQRAFTLHVEIPRRVWRGQLTGVTLTVRSMECSFFGKILPAIGPHLSKSRSLTGDRNAHDKYFIL
jgi:hypothetical protein